MLESRKDEGERERTEENTRRATRKKRMHLIYTDNKRLTSHDQYYTCKDVLMAAKDSLHEYDVEERGGSNVSNTRTRLGTLVQGNNS